MRTQTQKEVRSGSSVSTQPPPTPCRRARDDELYESATKIGLFCVPWIAWRISGPWVIVAMMSSNAITAHDDLGEEILYQIPLSVRAEFFTSTGQDKVSTFNDSNIK